MVQSCFWKSKKCFICLEDDNDDDDDERKEREEIVVGEQGFTPVSAAVINFVTQPCVVAAAAAAAATATVVSTGATTAAAATATTTVSSPLIMMDILLDYEEEIEMIKDQGVIDCEKMHKEKRAALSTEKPSMPPPSSAAPQLPSYSSSSNTVSSITVASVSSSFGNAELDEEEDDDGGEVEEEEESNAINISTLMKKKKGGGKTTATKKRTNYSKSWEYFCTETDQLGKEFVSCLHCSNFRNAKSGSTSNQNLHLRNCEGIKLAIMEKKRKLTEESGDGDTDFTESEKKGQLTLRQRWDGNLELGGLAYRDPYSEEALTAAIIEMIILCELPFTFIEKSSFRKVLEIARPEFVPKSADTMRKYLMEIIFPAWKNFIKGELQNQVKMNTLFSFTTDIWTASSQNIGYMCVTVHYIDTNFNLVHFVLEFCKMPIPHSGENIAQVLYNTFADYGIEKNLMSVVCDNASNNDSAMNVINATLNTLHSDPDSTKRPYDGNYLHCRCVPHILNLFAKSALEVKNPLIATLRNYVKMIRTSPKQKEFFQMCVRNDKVLSKVKDLPEPTLDVATRWNSTFDMIKSCLPYKNIFNNGYYSTQELDEEVVEEEQQDTATKKKTYLTAITENDWKTLEQIMNFLNPLKDGTEKLSTRNIPSLPYVVPFILTDLSEIIYSNLLIQQEEEEERRSTDRPVVGENEDNDMRSFAKTFKNNASYKMATKYQKYFTKEPEAAIVAHLLDPRLKLEYIQSVSSTQSFNPAHYESVFKKALKLSIINEHQAKQRQAKSTTNAIMPPPSPPVVAAPTTASNLFTSSPSNITAPSIQKKSSLKAFLESESNKKKKEVSNMSSDASGILTAEKAAMEEMQRYFSSELEIDSENFCILNWWKFNQHKYPALAKLARDFLSIPASSVESESAFSTSGRIVTDVRNSLHPDTAQAVILTQSWIRCMEGSNRIWLKKPKYEFPFSNKRNKPSTISVPSLNHHNKK
jgi:hypothetical protein